MKTNLIILCSFLSINLLAQSVSESEKLVDQSIANQSSIIESLQSIQKRIDSLDAESKKLTNEYKDTIVEYEILKNYDDQLEKITESQFVEIKSFIEQIESLDETNKYVLPLLERMVVALRELIEIDVPFLIDERMARLQELESILYQANFTTAEKFRKIYEAYQIENEYGRTIEAYSSSISVDGIVLAADFFRLGRLNLFYRTPDGKETGYWNANIKDWQHEGSSLNANLKSALDIANRQSPPNFINLPLKPVDTNE
jgi:vacuolar-type H+-ATPase subunit I/STV1